MRAFVYGRRARLTHPDNQAFTYAYDNMSRLSGVYQGTGTPLATFAYASNGLVSSRSEGIGVSGASYGWDDVGRLTSQSDTFSGGTNNVAWTFAYNPASQIVTETRDNDSYGFAKSAASATYTVNGLNQYATVNGAAFAYDANGNLTGTGSAAYTYDIENRLVKAVSGGTTTNLVYDPLGRLFEVNQGSSATTRFLNDGDAMVAELNSSNFITNRFVHGSNAAADDPLVWYSGSTMTIKRWLHGDHLGSVVAVTNSSGGSPSINRYDEYGVPASTNIGRFQYTGQAWIGELGLYYYKARFYSPALGRFMQTDPVGYDSGMNLYAYIEGDPVNGVDPDCQQPESVMDRRNQALLEAMKECEGRGSECAAAIGEGVGLALTAASVLTAPEILAWKALPWLGRVLGFGASRISQATRTAMAGGRHSGLLRQYAAQRTISLQRTIRSLGKKVEETKEKIRDPARHMTRDDPSDPTAVQRAVKDWKDEIQTLSEERDIARDVLRTRDCTGTRLCF